MVSRLVAGARRHAVPLVLIGCCAAMAVVCVLAARQVCNTLLANAQTELDMAAQSIARETAGALRGGRVPTAEQLERLLTVAGRSESTRRCLSAPGNRPACLGREFPPGTELVAAAAQIAVPWQGSAQASVAVRIERSRSDVQRQLPLLLVLQPALLAGMAVGLAIWSSARERRRLALFSDVAAAAVCVGEGDYGHQLVLPAGAATDSCAESFNTMTSRIASTVDELQAMAEIDRLILSGSSTRDVIRQVLELARETSASDCGLVLGDAQRGDAVVYGIVDGVLSSRKLEHVPPGVVQEGQSDVAARPSAPAQLDAVVQLAAVGCQPGAVFPVRREGALCGALFTAVDVSLTPEGERNLCELAERVSVAATNEERSVALYRQANYDVLTGLINRQAFADRLKEHVIASRRSGQRGALLFLDLDRFKQVNDTEGHLAGDELLRLVSRRLESTLRQSDVVARLGGDEFAVIVPECASQVELNTLCERVIAAVCQPITVHRLTHSIDVSVGVSLFPDDGPDTGSLLMKADVAMYKAKSQSGSAYAFYDQSLNRATERRVLVESRLRESLEQRQLILHFQPILDLRRDRIARVEGLIRWPHPELKLTPDEFIPVAEETGLIHQFTDLLVEQSAACLARCRQFGVEAVAINVSSQQFSREAFADQLLDALVRHAVPSREIELEITESVFIHDATRVTNELNKLRAAGVRVALDDFGTGYSSLNMLRTLPLDTLKIDRSFIRPLLSSSEALEMASKIIEMARLLHLEVVAEGVEFPSELELLRELGCDNVQGFVLTKPLGLDELCVYLASRSAAPKPVPLKLVRNGPGSA